MSNNMNHPVMSLNHLASKTFLKNKYFALRHGQSLANVAKIISSDPQISVMEHGLSDVGVHQVEESARTFARQITSSPNNNLVMISSDFKRARETSNIFCNYLKNEGVNKFAEWGGRSKINELATEHGVNLHTSLRERYFGDFNAQSDDNYHKVWKNDESLGADHSEDNVESVNSVLNRTTKLICQLEEEFVDHNIICVAHGDVLQILQTGFAKLDGSLHRTLPHLETATVRSLILKDYSA